eukprot:2614041-Pyramimonas_sp.AAC.1
MAEWGFFTKAWGGLALAANQRSILCASAICKVHHKHLRRLSLDYRYCALITQQCGGMPGRSCDTAVHFV